MLTMCTNSVVNRTKRNVHSHQEKAPLTTHHNQVTGYGDVSVHVQMSDHNFRQ